MPQNSQYSPFLLISVMAIAAPAAAKKAQPPEMLALVNVGAKAPVQPTPTRRVAFDLLDALEMAAADGLLGPGGLDPAIDAASKELRPKTVAPITNGDTRGHFGDQKTMGINLPAGRLPRFDMRQRIYNRGGAEHQTKHRGYPRLSRSQTGAVDYVFGRAFSGVADCYGNPIREEAVRRDTIVTVVVVNPTGNVIDARILRSKYPADDQLRGCIASTLTELRFPAGLGSGPVEIAYPWHFVIR